MPEFIYKLAGIEPEGGDAEVIWTSIPRSWLLIVALLGLVGIVWVVFRLYQSEAGGRSRGVTRTMALLRSAVWILLALALAGPALVFSRKETVVPSVPVLIDRSASMSLADGGDASRLQRAVAAVEGELERLGQRGQVKLYGFDRTATPADMHELKAEGASTDLAEAIRSALAEEGAHPAAGMLVITDGQHNEAGNTAAVGRVAGERGTPIFTLGIGNPAEPLNLKVGGLWCPDSVFRNDPFVIEAQVLASSGAPLPRQVDLSVNGEVVDSRTVTLGGNEREARVKFTHTPELEGELNIAVQIAEDSDEAVSSDNMQVSNVEVLADQARVLLIAGSPTWEYRMVAQMLDRDRTIDVSCWLQSMDLGMRQDGNTPITRLPATAEELFAYDVVVMLDPNPDDFDAERAELYRRFVSEHAGGLLYQAGAKYAPEASEREDLAKLREVFPVEIAGLSRLELQRLRGPHTERFPVKLTAQGVDHQLLRLSAAAGENESLWQRMPQLYWSFPAKSASPAAQVLMTHPNPAFSHEGEPRPLLVAGRHGRGRSVYMGFNDSWIWRRKGEKFFDQYWVQTVRFLTEGRLLGGQRQVRVDTDAGSYERGAPIRVTARIFTADFQPAKLPHANGVLTGSDGLKKPFVLEQIAGRPGEYEGSIASPFPGANELLVEGPAGTSGSVKVEVRMPQREFTDLRLNEAVLRDLADKSGGGYFPIGRISEAVDLIPDRYETLVTRSKPVHLWDRWTMLALVVVLLGLEWILRKRAHLI